MIYLTEENSYVISAYGVWKPGNYIDERTARYAFRFNNLDLETLQEIKNKTTKLITFNDLKKLMSGNN